LVPQVVLSVLIVVLTRGRLGLFVPSTPCVIPRSGRGLGRWAQRVVSGALAAFTVVAGLGALVEAVAADRDRRAFPPPGRLIDLGGYRLHLHILGEPRDRPTIILEAGLDSFSTNWYW